MRKKYQIFISSTFVDLQLERQAAVEAILMAQHIPAGMELFCAGDESQLDVVKRWIDDSDMYCLLLGARYGSIEPKSGNSYTEVEYDYALSLGKPFFALVLSDDYLDLKVKELGHSLLKDQDNAKWAAFRMKVLSRITRPVSDTKDIKLYTLEAIRGLENRYTLNGWVRSTEAVDVAPFVEELGRVRNERDRLNQIVTELEAAVPKVARGGELAGLDSQVSLNIDFTLKGIYGEKVNTITVEWGNLFALIGPKLQEHPNDGVVQRQLPRRLLGTKIDIDGVDKCSIDDHQFETVRTHLAALGLIDVRYTSTIGGGAALFWNLTRSGTEALLELRSVKSKGQSPGSTSVKPLGQ